MASKLTQVESEALFTLLEADLRSKAALEAWRLRCVGGFDTPDADELLGDAWLGVLAGARRWTEDGGASMRSFVLAKASFALKDVRRNYAARVGISDRKQSSTCAVRRALARSMSIDAVAYRRDTPNEGVSDDWHLQLELFDDKSVTPPDFAEQREISERVLAALRPRLRDLAEWLFVSGFRLVDWAEKEGISKNRADQLSAQLRAQLDAMRTKLCGCA